MGTPPLPYRVRPPQILLGVGAVLLVSAGAAVVSADGALWTRALLLVLAGAAAVGSLILARLGTAPEVLAATATALGLIASAPAGLSLDGEPVTAAVLAVAFLGLSRISRRVAVWPLAAWWAAQLAVLRTLDDVPAALHTTAYLTVALAGLGIALFGRPLVARVAFGTAAPWWVAGVVTGTQAAWDRGWLSALLVVGAAAGLLVARLREPLDPLLGPPRAVPIVTGLVAGAALAGPFSTLGGVAVALTGFIGVLLATVPSSLLTGWRRGLLEPVTVTAGIVVAALSVIQLAGGGRWAALSLLLLLTALPTVLVVIRRPDERSVALPTAVGCLAAAVLLALPDHIVSRGLAAALLTALYATAMVVGSALHSRRATVRVAALCAVAALLLAAADQSMLSLHLAVQGLFTLGWAWRTPLSPGAWRVGAGQLVLAAWVGAAAADLHAVEWYSLSAAAGLLVAAGRQLTRGPSWPAWGPGLLVAAVPSAVLAVVTSDGTRAVAVLVVAAGVLVAGAYTGLRAPLMIGAFTALWLAVGFAVRALPWPLGTALAVGTLLLALGARREQVPVAGFGGRLADLR